MDSTAPTSGRADWAVLETLFAAYVKGDGEATRRLFGEFTRVLRAYYRVRMGDQADAEDLLQATLLKIHFARDRYDPTQSLKTWVFTVASRSLIDHWRGISSESEVLERSADPDSEAASIVEAAPSELLSPEQKSMLHNDLNHGLAKLKPLDRSIVYLYGVEGLSMAEIARSLSLTEGATKLRAHRAYRELRRILE